MKYYCQKKWYRNVYGVLPCAGEVGTHVVLGYQKAIEDRGTGVRAADWRWDPSGYPQSDIMYFRVEERTPQLVENPCVQLSEMFQPREG